MTAERTSSLNTISLKNASILVVDDEEGMRHFITKVLEPQGHIVVATSRPASIREQFYNGFVRLTLSPLSNDQQIDGKMHALCIGDVCLT